MASPPENVYSTVMRSQPLVFLMPAAAQPEGGRTVRRLLAA